MGCKRGECSVQCTHCVTLCKSNGTQFIHCTQVRKFSSFSGT